MVALPSWDQLLASISADIPATWKLCGFLSHSARRGC